ncbi:hypothetical protein GCM10010987_43530 [Bradyrhizobium guangdongense]|uniref:Uncharacterized protein n=2 Tax=Bradyrhizobium guangdongense TaxID=1325090 RepID=A0AA88B9L6_9BRAD|nr:hypothetical protein GCM10010987_43530 [Bradyrhizobium guangdongense]
MAQIPRNGLFEPVLPQYNAGSRWIAVPAHAATLPALLRWSAMTHSSLRPMDAFDPTEPAILHDRVSGTIITWTADQAEDYRRASRSRGDGTVAWRAYVFDGWGNVMGG